MRLFLVASVAMVVVIAVALPSAAAPIDAKAVPPSRLAKPTPLSLPSANQPNIAVLGVRLGSGTGDRFAPLEHSPMLGEKISLICNLQFVERPPGGWVLAWYVDGVKTCGEGMFTTAPSCEFIWNIGGGDGGEVYIDWVGHDVGSHTYRCSADIYRAVTESSERDNSKQMSFEVKAPPQPISPDRIPVTAPRLGPRFRQLR